MNVVGEHKHGYSLVYKINHILGVIEQVGKSWPTSGFPCFSYSLMGLCTTSWQQTTVTLWHWHSFSSAFILNNILCNETNSLYKISAFTISKNLKESIIDNGHNHNRSLAWIQTNWTLVRSASTNCIGIINGSLVQ